MTGELKIRSTFSDGSVWEYPAKIAIDYAVVLALGRKEMELQRPLTFLEKINLGQETRRCMIENPRILIKQLHENMDWNGEIVSYARRIVEPQPINYNAEFGSEKAELIVTN